MKKRSRLALALVAVTAAISVLLVSCSPQQASSTTTSTSESTIQRGNLSIDITAVGNLALSTKEDLAFEIPGTVEEVLVKEGDIVQAGQTLVSLDTSEWEKQVTTVERQVLTAERQVSTAEKALRDKKRAVITAENNVVSKEYALRQADIDVKTAENSLVQIADVKKIQDRIDAAQQTYNTAKNIVSGNFSIGMPLALDNYWTNLTQMAKLQWDQALAEKQALIAGTSVTATTDVMLEAAKRQLVIEQKKLALKQAELDLEDAKAAVTDAQKAAENAAVDLTNAKADLVAARSTLADVNEASPVVTAPFDGFITNVTAEGGDEVKKGTVAVQIAESNKFKAEVLVSEMDISKVKLGSRATIELQAVSGASFPAEVTHISPTATIQQGVVNYKVTVELRSLQPISRTNSAGTVQSGNASGRALGGFGPGGQNLTPEQLAQIRERFQQSGGTPPAGLAQGGLPGGMTQEQFSQLAQQRQQAASGQTAGQGAVSANTTVNLAEGMTVTVNLPVDSRINVVLVPNSAITSRGGQSFVSVAGANGAEERQIQTGIADWQNTEVTSGLSAGEKVIITRTTSTATSSTQQRQQTISPFGGATGGAIRR